jgi:hypothetical protein
MFVVINVPRYVQGDHNTTLTAKHIGRIDMYSKHKLALVIDAYADHISSHSDVQHALHLI